MVAVGMPTLSSALAACPAGPTSPPRLAGAMVVPLSLSLPCDSMRMATAVACFLLCTRLLLRSSLGMAASIRSDYLHADRSADFAHGNKQQRGLTPGQGTLKFLTFESSPGVYTFGRKKFV